MPHRWRLCTEDDDVVSVELLAPAGAMGRGKEVQGGEEEIFAARLRIPPARRPHRPGP